MEGGYSNHIQQEEGNSYKRKLSNSEGKGRVVGPNLTEKKPLHPLDRWDGKTHLTYSGPKLPLKRDG